MNDCLKSLTSPGMGTTAVQGELHKNLMSKRVYVAVSPRGPPDCTMVSHGKMQLH